MISDKPIVEICIFVQGGERDYFIKGHNGRFNWGLLQKWEDELSEDPPGELESAIREAGITHGFVTLIGEMMENESETQYGTGYGDIYTLPAYYDFKLIEVTEIEEVVTEEAECAILF